MTVKNIVGNDILVRSPTPPENPEINMLWLDTSEEGHDILKRWDGEQWHETTLSQEEIDNMYGVMAEYRTQIEQIDKSITLRVTQEQMNESLSGKADSLWVTRQLESIIEQTSKDITFSFEQSQQYTVEATEPFKQYIEEVKAYQRFSADGLELGEIGSPFMARLGKDRLSFLQDGVEIAYISNNKLYITEAQVTEQLSVGKDVYGYFDWIMTETG